MRVTLWITTAIHLDTPNIMPDPRTHFGISTSPAQLEDVERSVREFHAGTDASLRLRLVSNWKFGVLAMGLVALPGVLLMLATGWHVATAGFTKRRA